MLASLPIPFVEIDNHRGLMSMAEIDISMAGTRLQQSVIRLMSCTENCQEPLRLDLVERRLAEAVQRAELMRRVLLTDGISAEDGEPAVSPVLVERVIVEEKQVRRHAYAHDV